MSNLPDGLTENHPHFNPGPEVELTEEKTCGSCGETSLVEVERVFSNDGSAFDFWTCPFQIPAGWDDEGARVCGFNNEDELSADDLYDGPDTVEEADRW